MAHFGFLGPSKTKREFRKSARVSTGGSGWIRLDGGFAKRACRVLDISDTGVCLSSDDLVPNAFTFLSDKGGPGRRARVKWRRGKMVGAEFF